MNQDWLAQLAPAHAPAAVGWWPPAPGWWVLAIIVLCALGAGVWMLLRQWRERRWRRRVVAELDRIAALNAAQPNGVRLAADVSQLLRRASLLIEPGAAALQGEEWLAFLDSRFNNANAGAHEAQFRTDAGRALIDAPYRRTDDPAQSEVDAAALLGLARRWLRRALPRGSSRV